MVIQLTFLHNISDENPFAFKIFRKFYLKPYVAQLSKHPTDLKTLKIGYPTTHTINNTLKHKKNDRNNLLLVINIKYDIHAPYKVYVS